MFIVLKACFLVGLICFTFCEGLLPVIIGPILNPSGQNSLVPFINLTLEIKLPQSTCCPSCNPPATCKPCPPPIACATCPACPPPPTCPTCPTCPTSTPCPTPSPCPPDFEKTCGDANAIYCAKAGVCITTVFSPRNYSSAVEKCMSLSIGLNFQIVDQKIALANGNMLICIKRAVPAMIVDGLSEGLWDSPFNATKCYKELINVKEDEIVSHYGSYEQSCDSPLPFYCVAKL